MASKRRKAGSRPGPVRRQLDVLKSLYLAVGATSLGGIGFMMAGFLKTGMTWSIWEVAMLSGAWAALSAFAFVMAFRMAGPVAKP